jgi:O-antigen ligase
MRALRHGFERADLTGLVIGSGFTLAIVFASVQLGAKIGAGSFLVVAAFCVVLSGWLFAPHVVVALSIPLFAAIPAAKVLVTPWVGPAKDLVTLAAAVAVLGYVIQREKRARSPQVDRLLIMLVVAFLGLYVVNLGGSLAGSHQGAAWAQGVRLIGEPLVLLTAGLTLNQPRRTLNIAVTSLIATGVVVALYGIYQQLVGPAGLLGYGYTYKDNLRTIAGHLRSFGTLDDPFAYAAFLLLALCAALFWMRRGPLKAACMSVITIGLALSYVRSALVISIALAALWLLSLKRVTLGLLLLGVSGAAALALLFAVAGANETHSVQAGPNTYITLNGRTTVWATVFARPSKIPFGLGVGAVGTAADRARYGAVVNRARAEKKTVVVDSGYFATVADVGVVGLVILIALLSRIVALGIASTRKPGRTGWLIIGWIAVLAIDAVTRASFVGFPTAFLGMLLIGVGIAASAEPPIAARRR